MTKLSQQKVSPIARFLYNSNVHANGQASILDFKSLKAANEKIVHGNGVPDIAVNAHNDSSDNSSE